MKNVKRKYRFFTEDEIQFLKDNYRKMSLQELADKLGCTKQKISSKLHQSGISQSWRKMQNQRKKEMDTFIKQNFHTMEIDKIAEHVHLTPRSVYQRYRNILLQDADMDIKINEHNSYTDADYQIIRTYYPTEGGKCASRLTSEHTKESVRSTAAYLGVKYIGPHSFSIYRQSKMPRFDTLENREFILANKEQPAKFFAKKFGCSESTIYKIRKTLKENDK